MVSGVARRRAGPDDAPRPRTSRSTRSRMVEQVMKKNGASPKSQRSEKKRRQILDAAADILARRGYAGTMLSEVAAQINSQPGGIYYHFESREHLFEEVLRHGLEDAYTHTRKAVNDLPATATPIERLETAIRAHCQRQLTSIGSYVRAVYRVMSEIPDEMRQKIEAQQKAYGRFFETLIGAAIDAGELEKVDRRAFMFLMLGSINWLPQWFNPNGRLSVDELCDLVIKMNFEGVASPAGRMRLRRDVEAQTVDPSKAKRRAKTK
ncbi:TetR family transcriptional regulator [Paraburkholderia sp.]|uniref:TetR family transcriptional regulator n=1 Tax=Paraburkholderia sp. TaxID=1926495 RepID=UPI0039E6211D